MLPFPPSLSEAHGIFPQYSLWDPGLAPGDKTHKSVEISLWLGFSEVFNFQVCPHWASCNWSTIVQLFLSWNASLEMSADGYLLQSVVMICISPSVSLIWAAAFCPHFSNGPKKNCWPFSLFSFTCWDGVMPSKFFSCQTRNCKSEYTFKNYFKQLYYKTLILRIGFYQSFIWVNVNDF